MDPPDKVTLVVGPEEERMEASVTMLRLASDVFGKMLGPNFKEGRSLSSSNNNSDGDGERRGEIALPEDDAGAMRVALQLMEYEEPEAMTAGTLETLARLADKYDLRPTRLFFRQQFGVWRTLVFSTGGEETTEEDSGTLASVPEEARERERERQERDCFTVLCAAFLLDQAAPFREISRHIVLNQDGPALGVTMASDLDVEMVVLLSILSRRRSEVKIDLIEKWMAMVAYQDSISSASYVSSMESNKVDDPMPKRVWGRPASKTIEELGNPPMRALLRNARRTPVKPKTEMARITANAGLCIDCVKGELGYPQKLCRIDHQ